MASTSFGTSAVILVLVLLAALVVAGISFGFVQTLLVVAVAASAAMLCAFVAVAASRNAY